MPRLCGAPVGPLSGQLADRYGARPVLVAGLLAAAASSALAVAATPEDRARIPPTSCLVLLVASRVPGGLLAHTANTARAAVAAHATAAGRPYRQHFVKRARNLRESATFVTATISVLIANRGCFFKNRPTSTPSSPLVCRLAPRCAANRHTVPFHA